MDSLETVSTHIGNPLVLLRSIRKHRFLINQLVNRQLRGPYDGAYLAALWLFLEPILMLAVYTIVFRSIMHRHWYSSSESLAEFGILLFTGLMIFNFFREVLSAAPSLIQKHSNYVKKVVFPLELLPFIVVTSAFIKLLVSTLFLMFISTAIGMNGMRLLIFLPIIFPPFLLLSLGAAYALSAAGVFVRDTVQVVSLLVMSLLFLSAVFFPIPEMYRSWFLINPVAYVIDTSRHLLIDSSYVDLEPLVFYYPISIFLACLGFLFFQRAREGFSDAI